MTTEQVLPEKPEPSDVKSEGSGFSAFHHHFYHCEGVTDLSVMRQQAQRRANERMYPRSTVIHCHAKEEPCQAEYAKHHVYNVGR